MLLPLDFHPTTFLTEAKLLVLKGIKPSRQGELLGPAALIRVIIPSSDPTCGRALDGQQWPPASGQRRWRNTVYAFFASEAGIEH